MNLESLKSKSHDWVGGVPCTRSHSDEKSRHSSDVFRFQYVTQQDPCNDWIPAECTIISIQAYSESSEDKRLTHFYLLCGGAEIQSVSCTVHRQNSVYQTVKRIPLARNVTTYCSLLLIYRYSPNSLLELWFVFRILRFQISAQKTSCIAWGTSWFPSVALRKFLHSHGRFLSVIHT